MTYFTLQCYIRSTGAKNIYFCSISVSTFDQIIPFAAMKLIGISLTFVQGAAPITTLSETSSDPEDSEAEYSDKLDVIDVNVERLFVTGFLDELKVCFSYSYQVSLVFLFSMKLPCDGSA